MGLGSRKSPRQSAPDYFQLAARPYCMKGVFGIGIALLTEVSGADVYVLKVSHWREGIMTSMPGEVFLLI